MEQYRGEPEFSIKGVSIMLITILIWVAFLLSMRAEAQSELTTTDLGLMRFALPTLVFLPWLLRDFKTLLRVKLRYLVMIICGGLPFFLLVSLGSQYAPVAHAGALVPGTAPLFVTGLAVLIFREPLPRYRGLGLSVILGGVTILLAATLFAAELNSQFSSELNYGPGHLAFLGASLVWAIYTLGLRVAGIDALLATALLCCSATLGLMLSLSLGISESNIANVSWQEIWPHLLSQGLGAGIIGGITYGIAIKTLGAEKTAALGSLTPALAAIIAVPVLGEQLSVTTISGVALIMTGVLLASGALRQTFRATRTRPTLTGIKG
ncbi:DMT family transporter [Amphritea balenae]|uniref:DMT family transporter n=1 Tax=Amphritea balenae TaxID=452629 RepID=A0A3P1SZS0_9GAMM|nr:DMT family transporter [Amphritea balenae]RRD01633.1 DMT family transporter [Amphritea balenae]GGK55418.1 hypothetical protein GCM10007941_01880 [Amphritea balenae]